MQFHPIKKPYKPNIIMNFQDYIERAVENMNRVISDLESMELSRDVGVTWKYRSCLAKSKARETLNQIKKIKEGE